MIVDVVIRSSAAMGDPLCMLHLQVSERIISDGRLLSKSLAADVERITREKQVAQERAETTKVGGLFSEDQEVPVLGVQPQASAVAFDRRAARHSDNCLAVS